MFETDMGLKPKNSQQFSNPQLKLWAIKNINPELAKVIESGLAPNASRVTIHHKGPKASRKYRFRNEYEAKAHGDSLQISIPQLKLWAIKI